MSSSPASPSSAFRSRLRELNPDPAGRRWVFVPYDQLTDEFGPLAHEDPSTLGILLVETPAKGRRRPYHKQKLALLLANLRHFALEQAARGVAVRHLVHEHGYAPALADWIAEHGPLRMMEAAERELRQELAPLIKAGLIEVLPHEGWLTTRDDFIRGCGAAPPWRMDAFYRQVRRRSGILMEKGKPVGGKFSFDAENREPWRGTPPAPTLPAFAAFGDDPIKDEVVRLVAEQFADHPGTLDPAALPVTRADALRLWAWARAEALPHFGPFEDAMAARERNLFHTRISALVNLHRLTPARILEDVLALDLPLASREGFVRQVLGWREFVRHVHVETDGFRTLDPEGAPSALGACAPLPRTFWGGAPSGMNCLDTVVTSVWDEGYSHHITRLMVLSNVATLLDVSPRALTDWFWVAYTDAYDWVVEPNVLGMGTFGTGDLMTTKPYVSGAPYIKKMSDYCDGCALDPETTCPMSDLYWAFLNRHRARLEGNLRMRLPLASAARRVEARKAADARVMGAVHETLAAGRPVTAAVVKAARQSS
jgi:deoxyribodipyrimidine photolyase-related protein